jgi:hypothetical protein
MRSWRDNELSFERHDVDVTDGLNGISRMEQSTNALA